MNVNVHILEVMQFRFSKIRITALKQNTKVVNCQI